MALKINPKFNPADITKMVREKVQEIENEVIDRLQFIGETFVNNARDNGTYTDRTGNLRSSIGYVIIKNGKQIFSAFDGETEEGKANGMAIAAEASKKFKKGIALIVVAGMDYAGYVESKSYDVLTASSITAENDLKASIEEMRKQL